MALSLTSMAAIVIVLIKYDGRVFPSVPGEISLNAIVATLSTISKTSLIFSVSAVLGQLKWDWFEKQPRQLDELETFDQASRGPLGAMKLLLGGTARSVASIGAVITILALALDPFVQQVVGTAPSFSDSDDAWTERQTSPAYFTVMDNTDAEYRELLNGAIWNDASVYDRRANCPGGNCRFESFETLEFCVDTGLVTDLTSLAVNCNARLEPEDFEDLVQIWKNTGARQSKSHDCTVSFQGDGSDSVTYPIELSLESPIDTVFGYTNVTESYSITYPRSIVGQIYLQDSPGATMPRRIKVRHSLTTLASLRFVLPPDSFDVRDLKLAWAEWASLSLCRTKRSVSVIDGSTATSTYNTSFGAIFAPDLRKAPLELGQQAECWSPYPNDSPLNTSITYNPKLPVRQGSNGVLFTTDYPTTLAFCASNLYWGADVWKRLSSVEKFSKTIYRAHGSEEWRQVTSDETGRPQIHEFFNPKADFASQDIHKRIQSGTLQAVIRSMAAALNNFSLARTEEASRVRGMARLSETIVKVRWPWLVLPLVVEALGFVLLVVATLFSKRQAAGLWKDSLLAVLYHGLDREDGRLHGESTRTMTDMKMMAKRTRVGLVAKTTTWGEEVLLASK